MKVHYINILLLEIPLNILKHNQRNHNSAIYHISNTKAIKPHRTLCECELYAPSNYKNDQEMKEVMDNFYHQTSERFREYDERVQDKRKRCKEQYEKDIQKIILKDKIEKQLAQQFSTLQTNIDSHDIPTCVCEKSMADRTEKFCLKCGYEIGGGMLQSFGLLGGIGEVALNAWKSGALLAAEKAAIAEGLAEGAVAGEAAGKNVIIGVLQKEFHIYSLNGISLQPFFNSTPYTEVATIASAIDTQMTASCDALGKTFNETLCGLRKSLNLVAGAGKPKVEQETVITKMVTQLVDKAKLTAKTQATDVSSATYSKIINKQTALIEAGFDSSTTSIYASIIVILIIVLIMVIIYLILRYRRKKKMKKKLQYIKLLEE